MGLRYCIQCHDKISGKVGDFAFDEEKPFEATSPVFRDLIEFYQWMRENGLKEKHGDNFVLIKAD